MRFKGSKVQRDKGAKVSKLCFTKETRQVLKSVGFDL